MALLIAALVVFLVPCVFWTIICSILSLDPILALLGGFIVGFITIMIINEAFEQIFIQHYEWFERGWIRLW